MDKNSNSKIPVEDSIDQELAVVGSNEKSELNKDLSFARSINDKSSSANDNVITLVDKKPQTSTKLHMLTLLDKDVSTYRRLLIRGVDMGDLLNPVLYTLINSADRVVFEGSNVNAKSNIKVGMLILYFTDILDRFTYLRRYLLNFEIPDRHIEIICTYPNDELPLNLLEEWKNSKKEDSPVCLSSNPDRLLLARQLVLKDSAGVGLANSDLMAAFKNAQKIEFVLDYNNVRCAVLTFPDMLSCHVTHMLQRTVKVKDKYMPVYLMSEMIINSKLKPAKLKETDEENHTRITFNALWQNLISAVEEIKNTKNSTENENSSKNNTTLKRKLSNATADSSVANTKQPKTAAANSLAAFATPKSAAVSTTSKQQPITAKTFDGFRMGPVPIPISKFLEQEEAKQKSAAAVTVTIKSESSATSATSSAKTSAATTPKSFVATSTPKPSAAATTAPKVSAADSSTAKTSAATAITPKTSAPATAPSQKTSGGTLKTMVIGSSRTQPVVPAKYTGVAKNLLNLKNSPQKTSVAASGKSSNVQFNFSRGRTEQQQQKNPATAAATVRNSQRFSANANPKQSAAATSTRSNVDNRRSAGLQSLFDVQIPAPSVMEMQQRQQQQQHMQQPYGGISQWDVEDVPSSPGPRSLLSTVPGYQYNNLIDSSANVPNYDAGFFAEPDFSANVGSTFDYNQDMRLGALFSNANYSAAAVVNNPMPLIDFSAATYGLYGGSEGLSGFHGEHGGSGGFRDDFGGSGGFRGGDYGGGTGFHGKYGGAESTNNWDQTSMGGSNNRASALPSLLPDFQGFTASPTTQRQQQNNRFRSPVVKYGRQYPQNSGRS